MLRILGKFSPSAFFRATIIALLAVFGWVSVTSPSFAARERTLYLYYTHTKETAKITFKRNGRYDRQGLSKLNTFLRDWRRNEPTKMDPRLFDLVWEVYQEVGATKPIHVVSAYRSPKTNEMLRSRSKGVAKNSNHTRGLAMDFFIPGVPVSKLRAAAMKLQMGGVGYYPTSGNPFVHLDTGSVRAWPRMTTAQLKRLFPKGKTMHIPSNGVVLSKAGYAQAKAEYSRCKQVPCNGGTRVASASSSGSSSSSGRTLMDVLFGRDDKKDTTTPAQRTVTSTPIRVAALKQLPPARPTVATDIAPAELITASVTPTITPPIKPAAIRLATNQSADQDQSNDIPSRFAVASLDGDTALNPSRFATTQPAPPIRSANVAQPNPTAAAALIAAYAPTTPPAAPDAQKALEIILNRQNGATELPVQSAKSDGNRDIKDALETASLNADLSDFTSILRTVTPGNTRSTIVRPTINLTQRDGELVLPDLEHVLDLMTEPSRFENAQYAVLFEPDEADISHDAVLGSNSQFGFTTNAPDINVSTISFVPRKTL